VANVAKNSSNKHPSLIDWAGGDRATPAITFTDIVGSTALAHELGDEAMRQIQEGHFGQSGRLIAAGGGCRIKGLGDGDMAVFKNVESALDYALALQAEPGHPILASRVRAGIHIGPVTVTIDDIHGNSVNFAARVGGATKAPEIWLSEDALRHLVTYRASRHQDLCWQDHSQVGLKGLPGSYRLWSVATAGRTLPEIAASKDLLPAEPPSVPSVAISNIPEGMVPRHFFGREQALDDIAAALEGAGGRAAITALHGLRGVGKTVLAAAYAEKHRPDYRATWWIRAETESGLRADLVGLAVRLGWVTPDEREEPALAVIRDRLRREGDGILLIFDNARDAEALRSWLPHGGACRVIVTSNAPNWSAAATPVAIRVWPKKTGADFLIARTGRAGERAVAETLSEALGGLPLAHEMVASYCERTGMSFAEYRRRFDAAPARFLDSDKDAPAEYHDRLTVSKTFALAIEEAAKVHPAAEPLIALGALLPPEPIPLFLFNEGREELGEPLATLLADNGLEEAVAALRTFALLDCETIPDERDPAITTDTIRLHRLVREVATARVSSDPQEAARSALIEALATVYPRHVDDDPHTWPRARRLDALALAMVGTEAELPKQAETATIRLMDRLASYRRAVLYAYAQAEPLYRRALAMSEASLGPQDPNVAASLNNLAELLRVMNQYGEAEPLYRRALVIIEARFGSDHPHVAAGLNNLGLLLQATNRRSEAEPLIRRALAIDEASLGPNHRRIATRLNNLGALLNETGRVGEAESLFRRALAIDEATVGPDHPTVAIDLNNLAGLLAVTNRLGEAEPLYRRALAVDEASFGSNHPEVAIDLNNLALLLKAMNRVDEAESLYRRALAILEATLGPDHPNTAITLQNLKALRPRTA
jgi:class 3 adenylate cyclase/tetratricopeptide (TPR) repeat protein